MRRFAQQKASGWRKIKLPFTATDAEKRQAALNYYYTTGDPGPARDMGVNFPDQRAAARQLSRLDRLIRKCRNLPPVWSTTNQKWLT